MFEKEVLALESLYLVYGRASRRLERAGEAMSFTRKPSSPLTHHSVEVIPTACVELEVMCWQFDPANGWVID